LTQVNLRQNTFKIAWLPASEEKAAIISSAPARLLAVIGGIEQGK
jgi:hypothetical protein